MIAKRIAAPKAAGGFKQLAAYLLREKSDKEVHFSTISNCGFDESDLAVKEVEATQQGNTRSQANKNYHLVVSFPEGEKPEPEIIADIENEVCKAIGYEDHQRISATHDDTENYHLHIAINKIDPITLNAKEPYYDKKKLVECCAELEKKHDLIPVCSLALENKQEKEQSLGQGAADFQAKTGMQSFENHVKELKAPIAEALDKSENWNDVNQNLSSIGLKVKLRGAGMVFSSLDEKRHVSASRVDRSYSKAKLSSRFGVFVSEKAMINNNQKPTIDYKKKPALAAKNPKAEALWQEYETVREESKVAAGEVNKKRDSLLSILKRQYERDKAAIKANKGIKGTAKREAYKKRYEEYKKKRKVAFADAAKIRKGLNKNAGNWKDFLFEKAVLGNTDALQCLRGVARRGQAKGFSFLSPTNKDDHSLVENMKPAINKSGDVTYKVDTDTIRDSGGAVSVTAQNEKVVMAAMQVAISKYGKTLAINGNDKFKAAAVKVAVANNMAVSFSDKDMEASRVELVKMAQPAQEKKAQESGITEWIEKRNQTKAKGADMLAHRRFAAEDAGQATFAGIRRIGERKVALYRKGDIMLINPINRTQEKQLEKARIGSSLKLSRLGTISNMEKDLGL